MPRVALLCHHAGCDKRAIGSSSSCGNHPRRRSLSTKTIACRMCGEDFTIPSAARTQTCSQKCKKERRLEQQRAWQWANADRVSAKGAKRYDEKREEIIEYVARWRQENKEAVTVARRHAKATRRAREEASKRLVTQRDLRRTLHRYGGCAYCSRKDQPLHWDHVTPLSRGGTTSKGNLLPACAPCNLSKGAKTVMEWRVRRM